MAGSSLAPAILLSLFTTTITILLTILFGTPLGYFLARREFKGRSFISVFVELPVVLPPAVAGLGLLVAFGRRGLFGPALEAVGLSLPFSTAAVVIYRRSGKARLGTCRTCSYNLTGNESGVCPECGTRT